MSKKGEIDLNLRADELGLELDKLAGELEQQFYQAIEDTANAAYASIVADAQSKLNSSRQDYIKALNFDKIGKNSFVISLDGDWANKLEEGYPSFNMKDGMLRSTKTVQVGSRTGQPWVQTSKKGSKFAHVPFEHSPHSKAPKTADLASAIRGIEVLNRSGRKQKLTSVFKDPSGRPLQGKVATVRNTDNPLLSGITKFQKTYTNEKTGKQTTQAIYMTWRTVSENGEGWMHPGFSGIKAFDEAELWVARELDNILKSFLG